MLPVCTAPQPTVDGCALTVRALRIPERLIAEWRREPEWLAALPRLAAECAAGWGLELEEPFDTPHSLVVAAGDAVLKLNAPSHFEADHEAEALACWGGSGAVRLLGRDVGRRALLVERCRPGTLLSESDADAIGAVAGLLERLPGEPPPSHPFRLLAEEAARWTEEVPRRYELGGRPFERSLLDAALDVYGTVERGARRLINQDLHGGNVLRASRSPWLVIDPKPLVGEPEVDGVGVLRSAAGDGPSVTRWLDALAGLGLDRERLRGWGFAHALAWGWDADTGWSARSIEAARSIRAAW